MSKRHYQNIILYILATVCIFASCTFGYLYPPVEFTVESPTESFEQSYRNALRAMQDVGRATSADRRAGYVNGISHSGLNLVVTFEKLLDGGIKVNTRAFLTEEQLMSIRKVVNDTDIADIGEKFVKAYKKHLREELP